MDIVLECNSFVSLLILELFKYHSWLYTHFYLWMMSVISYSCTLPIIRNHPTYINGVALYWQ